MSPTVRRECDTVVRRSAPGNCGVAGDGVSVTRRLRPWRARARGTAQPVETLRGVRVGAAPLLDRPLGLHHLTPLRGVLDRLPTTAGRLVEQWRMLHRNELSENW